MPLEAIEPRRLYRQIADQIRQLIDQGEYAVDSRLPAERELADMLGVSRPTVREALIALEVEGRLRIKVGSGVYINAPPASEHEADAGHEGPFEVLRARAFVEGAVAEIADGILRGDPPQLVHFGIADSDAWDVGLPCGGEIDVWVEAYEPGRFEDVARSGGRAAEVTVLEARGRPGRDRGSC